MAPCTVKLAIVLVAFSLIFILGCSSTESRIVERNEADLKVKAYQSNQRQVLLVHPAALKRNSKNASSSIRRHLVMVSYS